MAPFFDASRPRKSNATPRRRVALRPSCDTLERRDLMATNVLINQVFSYPYPANYPNQFVEIETVDSTTGALIPNASLAGYQFIRVDGYQGSSYYDTANQNRAAQGVPNGAVPFELDLGTASPTGGAVSTGSNGLLIIEAQLPSVAGGGQDNAAPPIPDPRTTVVHTPAFNLGNSLTSLGNGTNSYFVVNYGNGGSAIPATNPAIPTQPDYLDTNNTGNILNNGSGKDLASRGDTISDGISFAFHSATSVAADRSYTVPLTTGNNATGYFKAGSISPNGAIRIPGNFAPLSAYGDNAGSAGKPAGFVGGYFLANSLDNDPASGNFTTAGMPPSLPATSTMPASGGVALTPGWGVQEVTEFAQQSLDIARPRTGSQVGTLYINVRNNFNGQGLPANSTVTINTEDVTAKGGTNYAQIQNQNVPVAGAPLASNNGLFPVTTTVRNTTFTTGDLPYAQYTVSLTSPEINGNPAVGNPATSPGTMFLTEGALGAVGNNSYSTMTPSIANVFITTGGITVPAIVVGGGPIFLDGGDSAINPAAKKKSN